MSHFKKMTWTKIMMTMKNKMMMTMMMTMRMMMKMMMKKRIFMMYLANWKMN